MAGERRSREQWRGLVAQWRRSGQTQKAFAAEHGLVTSTLSWWCAELKREAPAPHAFVPVEVQAQEQTEPVAVLRCGEAALHIAPGVDPAWVAAVLKQLGPC